ncbi:MAG: ABC transporter ATP-binding protein/permease [Treponema sp.]|nr:ABC transporter ATP-binding protein/permease [Treponema sp.]
MFAQLAMGFIELIGVGSISPFIMVISNPAVIHTNMYLNKVYAYFNFSSDNSFIIFFGIAVIALITLSNLCLGCISSLNFFYCGRRLHSIAMRFLEKYLCQPYVFYLNINTADLAKTILSEIHMFVNRVLLVLLQLISSAIISLCILFLLIIINPLLASIVSMAFGLSYLIIFTFVRKFLAQKGRERTVQNGLKYKYINEIFGGIKDIKILGKEKVFMDFFKVPSKKSAMNDAISDTVNDMPKYLLETIAFGGILGVVIFMIASGIKIEKFLPVLTLYAFGAYRLMPSLQKIFKAAASIKYNFPVVKNLHRDFTRLRDDESIDTENIPKMNFGDSIVLDNISFQYPNTSKDVIKKQSLVITSNTSIALVGATGCGKTTLVDIILGLLEPQTGKIIIDDVEITGINRKSWQKNLGYVPQSIYLTDDTVRNNIAFGIAPEKIVNDTVIKAAKLANIHGFIQDELENGYNTIIGERGVRLSGGQRQRIGIARAVYHEPSVLIFDEATSALDSLTENAVIDAITNMSRKKTIIMIAHRLSTVKTCDIIYLMNKGIIIDHGNYDALYARNKIFRKMADGK